MAAPPKDRIARYLARAKEMRREAETFHNAETKALMLRLAEDYEALAAKLSKRDGDDKSK